MQAFVSAIIAFAAPGYAGALPGAFKNLLDWTVGGVEMDRKPVAWIQRCFAVGEDGAIRDTAVRNEISATLGALVDFLKTCTCESE
jgi:chromate reductase, NAD(P)H dehydrogenase (quinone)